MGWAGKFSILNAFYNAYLDVRVNDKILGKGFSNVFFVHKKGITSYYRDKNETDKFGEFIKKKASKKNKILIEWSLTLEQSARDLHKLLSKKIGYFLASSGYEELEELLYIFHSHLMAVYTAPDYLSKDLFKKYFSKLERARKLSEPIYDQLDKFFIRLLKDVARREGINWNLLLRLSNKELVGYFKKGILPKEDVLKKRKTCAVYYGKKGIKLILGKDALKIKPINSKPVADRGINGNIAYPGVVKGTVRIIHNPLKYKVFNKSDILVTGMTRPDFMPLVKRAGAIITDAGGILSHAAIVARELNKPCIIGTKIATKVLHDGDLVEVDAERGVVKILKRGRK